MPSVIGKIDEDLRSDDKDEEESFRTKKLFLFAWQIAKGMVITIWLFLGQRYFHSVSVFIIQRYGFQTISQARNKSQMG